MEPNKTTKIAFNNELNDKVLKGVKTLADAVGSTLGPRGRNVIIKDVRHKPFITKDGVTVARAVKLDDPFENAGAQIIKQAAESTVNDAGDGTTTSTVLANAILREAQPYLASGVSPVEVKRGIDLAVCEIVETIRANATPVETREQVRQIARVSANGDDGIAELIATAVDQVGKDGSISIKQSRTEFTSLDVEEGFTLDSGLCSKALVTDESRGVARYEDCNILVTDQELRTIDELMEALNYAARDGKPFVIVAADIKDQALAAIVMNHLRGNMQVCAIKAPAFGNERRDILKDLAMTVGAKFFTEEKGLRVRDAKLEDFGSAELVTAGRHKTVVVGGHCNEQKLEEHIEGLKTQLAETSNDREGLKLQERITRLSSGIAIIRVGGNTEIEATEKLHRVEDALEAVNSARQEGVVPGGGTTLLYAALELEGLKVPTKEQEVGVEIVRKACKAPLTKMLQNAGGKVETIVEKLDTEGSWCIGYDVATEKITNLKQAGVVDPAKVVRCALQNAASAAATLLTTATGIVEVESY